MNINTQSAPSKIVLILLAILMVSCQPTTPTTQNGGGNDIQDIRVQVTEPTKNTSKVEQFPLPNCGGSDKLSQSLGTFASVSRSATVAAKATVTGSGEVAIPETAKLKLEISVELAYQKTFETANSRLDTIVMSASGGTHVVYTIVWEEQTFNSTVQYSSDGKVYTVPYTYQLRVPKIDKSYNVNCSGDGTKNSQSENVITPTSPLINLVTNGNFEDGPYSWNGTGKVSVIEHDGGSALCSEKVRVTTDSPIWQGFSQIVPVKGNAFYSFNAQAELFNASNAHMKVVWMENADKEILGTQKQFRIENISEWNLIGGQVKAPAEAVYAMLVFWHGVENEKNIPGGKMCVDNVSFIEK